MLGTVLLIPLESSCRWSSFSMCGSLGRGTVHRIVSTGYLVCFIAVVIVYEIVAYIVLLSLPESLE